MDSRLARPLRIDEEAEKHLIARTRARLSPLGRLLRWAQPFSPFVLFCEPTFGRYSVELALEERPGFPDDAWSETEFDVSFTERVLRAIAHELNWPNHFFVPDDPLRLVLLTRTGDDPWELEVYLIAAAVGVNLSSDSVDRMERDGWSVGRFVEYLEDLHSGALRGRDDFSQTPITNL